MPSGAELNCHCQINRSVFHLGENDQSHLPSPHPPYCHAYQAHTSSAFSSKGPLNLTSADMLFQREEEEERFCFLEVSFNNKNQ